LSSPQYLWKVPQSLSLCLYGAVVTQVEITISCIHKEGIGIYIICASTSTLNIGVHDGEGTPIPFEFIWRISPQNGVAYYQIAAIVAYPATAILAVIVVEGVIGDRSIGVIAVYPAAFVRPVVVEQVVGDGRTWGITLVAGYPTASAAAAATAFAGPVVVENVIGDCR